ncbi:aquaporin [Streptomyces sp. 4F14]|uniref:aquaporin n=1 Tax=Streptomyces sp. 4F14 TaxID=3394380 RepID=UPI003A8A9589
MLTCARKAARRATGTTGTAGGSAARVEFALTAAVLFVLVGAVRWVMASPLGGALPGPRPRLAVVAVIVCAALALALSSAWGRRSGGHLNPAVTLALWVAGAFPGRRVLPYVAAQLAGSVAGTGLARLVWGPVVGGRMDYGAVRAAPGWPAGAVFGAEAGATAAILAVALLLMSRPAWAHLLPFATALVIVGLGTLTDGSANPARQFGPALWADGSAYWSQLWIYLLAPLAGAALPALVTRFGRVRSRGRRSVPGRCAAESTC